MTALVPAAVAGVAVLLTTRSSFGARVRGPARTAGPEHALMFRLRFPLSALAFAGGWVFLGGWAGAAAGALAAMFSWRVLTSVESPAVRRRRVALERELPLAVHLIGACLVAGAAIPNALEEVAAAMPGPVAEELTRIRHRLLLASDPVQVWSSLQGPLQGLGRSMARAAQSGSSVRDAVERLAVDLRADAHVRTAARARTIEVRAAAPLGVCFLPAFVILGVMPMVVGIFSSLALF